eukprot:1527593-Pleurochrysis_carterae.AAC.1
MGSEGGRDMGSEGGRDMGSEGKRWREVWQLRKEERMGSDESTGERWLRCLRQPLPPLAALLFPNPTLDRCRAGSPLPALPLDPPKSSCADTKSGRDKGSIRHRPVEYVASMHFMDAKEMEGEERERKGR